jgi:DNA-binding transcriptional MerR regulator
MSTTKAGDGLYIKEAARMVGVSAALLRLWEREGLLCPRRSPSGYRVYSFADIERARQARSMLYGEGLEVEEVSRRLGEPPEPDAEDLEGNGRVGTRVHSLRQGRGISLRALAGMTGLSASYISAVERSQVTPSVASLQKLAGGLGTNLVRLLAGRDELKEDGAAQKAVVGANEREVLEMEIPGVVIENLTAVESVLEPLLFHVEPGGGSSSSYSHAGDEFLFVLEGSFEVVLDETEEYALEAGDSMTFASHRPHRWRNPGQRKAEILWVNTPATF